VFRNDPIYRQLYVFLKKKDKTDSQIFLTLCLEACLLDLNHYAKVFKKQKNTVALSLCED